MANVPEHCASMPQSQLKVWQTWHGTHTFCCDGRVMVGPDIGATFFAALVTTATSATFWLFVCPSLSPIVVVGAALLYAMTIGFMVLTATTDPGILPRNPNVDDAEAAANAQSMRSTEINGVTVQLKWCHTCRIWRPPRASHCSECNVCVERFDHHCPWMGQCIGRRNYRYFIGFVVSVSLLCLYTAGASLSVLMQEVKHQQQHRTIFVDEVVQGVQRSPVVTTMLLFPLLVLLCVGPLACYHCGLVSDNRTTNEEIKGSYAGNNPFSHGWKANCHEVCCAALEVSRIHPRSVASEEVCASMLRTDGAVQPVIAAPDPEACEAV